ncbi:MAG: type IV pilus biogenesis/stability protein PilW [Steroidobacteraceae bacterium]|nr:type IV pilus biogenesis/stability protein PilW [Steroidobacteraceae bacterium]
MSGAAAMTFVLTVALALGGCASNNGLAPGQNPARAAIVNVQLAIAYMQRDKLAVARHFIDRALREDSHNATVQATAGLIYERLGETSKARRAYTEAARLGKADPDVMNTYGGYLCRNHHYDEGVKVFRAAIANPLYQTPEVAMVNAGVCLEGAGKEAAAKRYFKRALVVHPNMPMALLELGAMALRHKEPAKAAAIVTRYLAVDPPSAQILWLGLRAERALGHENAAAGYAQRLEKDFPSSTEARMLQAGITQ